MIIMVFEIVRIDRKVCSLSCAVLLVLFMVGSVYGSGSGSELFGFDIHHRFSDGVKAMFDNVGGQLPEMKTVDLYNAMVYRDRFFHGRRLALAGQKVNHLTPLTFADGNLTFNIPLLGFLYYANVSIGTPASWFLVALDTGSGLFWLPCDCVPNCLKSIELTPTQKLDFNIYSLSTSSTGKKLSCRSQSDCSYSVKYLSANTSSSGYYVKDILHLTTDANPSTPVEAQIAFGCGVKQTGDFLDTGAPNGLLGLSMDEVSVPSILALQYAIGKSFSMCFSKHGIGRISFGDSGSDYQGQTPFDPRFNLYGVTVTQVYAGTDVSAEPFFAFFDTGTSFTHLTDPAFTVVSQKFDSQVTDKRIDPRTNFPFKHCYEINSPVLKDLIIPVINLTMEGGHTFTVQHPAIKFRFEDGSSIYCLGVLRNEQDINIIGENFMTGYRIVFDREKMMLGWKASDCYEAVTPGILSPDINSSTTPEYNRTRSSNALLTTAASSNHFLLILIAFFVPLTIL